MRLEISFVFDLKKKKKFRKSLLSDVQRTLCRLIRVYIDGNVMNTQKNCLQDKKRNIKPTSVNSGSCEKFQEDSK